MKLRLQSFYKLTIFLVFLALVAASFVLTPRLGLEMTNKTVAQAVRYRDCYELIHAAGKYTDDVESYYNLENGLLKNMRISGINTLVLHDATLESLARTGAIGLELHDDVAIAKETHKEIFEEVAAVAKRRYGDKVILHGESPERTLHFYGNTKAVNWQNSKLERAVQQLPLGIMSHEIRKFYKLGFYLILAPENFVGITTKDVDAYFDRVKKTGIPIYGLMPARHSVLGSPNLHDYVASKMGRQHLVLQEHYTQLGFFPNEGQLELAQARNYDVLRAYTIDYLEMQKLDYKQAQRRWAIADDERNIRLNIIQPFLHGEDLLQTNLNYIKDIAKSVEKRGFRIGMARPLEIYFPNRILLIPVIAGIVAAFMLLCQSLFGWSYNRTVIIWGVLTGLGLFGNFVMATPTHQVMGFLAAISFPVLSVYRITDMLDDIQDVPMLQILANCAICLLLAVCFSLCGACLLAAVLTDARFVLEIDYYRGVKLTFLLPLVFILWICLKKYDVFGFKKCKSWVDYRQQIAKGLKKCCTWGMAGKILLFLMVVAAVLYIFVGRTGHSWQIPVPQIELNMRYWLEEHMYARPRVKEFLIGHVAFCFMVLAFHKVWPRFWQLLMVVGATVGQVSLVETFCHMRSPFLMSMARAAGGYIFGIVIGLLLVGFFLQLSKMKNSDE